MMVLRKSPDGGIEIVLSRIGLRAVREMSGG
jgi:hypothetical protein